MKKSLIYTRTGDKGETSLFGGKRVKKYSQRIQTIGAIDELNAILGLTATKLPANLRNLIEKIQNELFDFGAKLANPEGHKDREGNLVTISESMVTFLENEIDKWDAKLPKLNNFILPGGSEEASLLHICRSVARRAERELGKLDEEEAVDQNLKKYLNRLSDLLFVLARVANKRKNKKDKIWEKP